MTKREAVHQVASFLAGMIDASSVEDVTGLTEPEQEQLSGADKQRLCDAMEEVARRLWRMGTPPAG